MASSTIDIYDPADEPFGPLSNHFMHRMFIDSRSYPSVTNFIYSQLVRTPAFQSALRSCSNMRDIQSLAFDFVAKELKEIRDASLEVAYLVRFRHPRYREALLATGDAILRFKDDNEDLGTGASNQGRNMAGKLLMNVRSIVGKDYFELLKLQRDQNEYKSIYPAYRAYEALKYLIKTGRSDLEEFKGKSPQQILDMANVPTSDVVSLDIFIERFRRGDLPEALKNPGVDVAKLVRKHYLKKYANNLKSEQDKKIFIAVLSSFSQQNDITFDTLLNTFEEFGNVPFNNYLFQLIIDMFRSGCFPEVEAQLAPSLRPIPTEEEVKEASLYKPTDSTIVTIVRSNNAKTTLLVSDEVVEFNPDTITGRNLHAFDEDAEVIEFSKDDDKYDFLSPYNTTLTLGDGSSVDGWIHINGLAYPSPMYFMLQNQFEYVTGCANDVYNYRFLLTDPQKESYALADFKSVEDTAQEFSKFLAVYFINKTNYLCEKALDAKFEDEDLRQLLVATGAHRLVFNDTLEPNLGTGEDGLGFNFCGKRLEMLRSKFIDLGVRPAHVKPQTTVSIASMLHNNDELLKWFNSRLRDACTSVKNFYNYLTYKLQSVPSTVTAEIAHHVLFEMYAPCHTIRIVGDGMQVPANFNRLVDSHMKPIKVDADAVHIMFMYMMSLSKLLLSSFANSDVDSVAAELVRLQNALVNLGSDDVSASVLSATANILQSCKKFVRTMSAMKYFVTDEDIRFAQQMLSPQQQLPLTFENVQPLTTDNETKMAAFFSSHGLSVNPLLLGMVHAFVGHVEAAKSDAGLSRIAFFSSQTKSDIKTEEPKVDN